MPKRAQLSSSSSASEDSHSSSEEDVYASMFDEDSSSQDEDSSSQDEDASSSSSSSSSSEEQIKQKSKKIKSSKKKSKKSKKHQSSSSSASSSAEEEEEEEESSESSASFDEDERDPGEQDVHLSLQQEPIPQDRPKLPFNWKLNVQLRKPQQDILDKFKAAPFGIVGAGMGSGKTLASLLCVFEQLQKNDLPALLLVPKAVLDAFKLELQRRTDVNPDLLFIIKGRESLGKIFSWDTDLHTWRLDYQKHRIFLATIDSYKAFCNTFDFWNKKHQTLNLINCSNSAMDKKRAVEGRIAAFLLQLWSAIVIDEAHSLRNPASMHHRVIASLLRRSAYNLLLTGTSIVNKTLDFLSLVRLLDPQAPVLHLNQRPKSDDEKKEFDALLALWSEQYFFHCPPDVPPPIRKTISYVLADDHQREYDQFMHNLKSKVLQLEEAGAKNVDMEVRTALLRVRQTLNHPLLAGPHEKFNESSPLELPSPKIEAIVAEAVTLPGKTVLFSAWSQFLFLLGPHLEHACAGPGTKAVFYHGQMSLAERQQALETFASDPKAKFLLATYQAGGVGLNLQDSAQNVIKCDPWWNSAIERQAEARVNRQGFFIL